MADLPLSAVVISTSRKKRGGIQRFIEDVYGAVETVVGSNRVRLVELDQRRNRVDPISAARLLGHLRSAISDLPPPRVQIAGHVGVVPVSLMLRQAFKAPVAALAYGTEAWKSPWRHRLAAARVDRVWAISSYTRDRVAAEWSVDSERVDLLKPCVALPEPLDDPTGRPSRVILTVARLDKSCRYKGIDVLLKALPAIRKVVPGIQYRVVGDGDDRVYLEELARREGVSDCVTFLGGISDEALQWEYQSADVFALVSRGGYENEPTEGEGFGLVYLEAAARGRPTIVADAAGAREALIPGVTGLLVDPYDRDAVAAACIQLLIDDELRARMGRAGRQMVSSEYSVERFVGDVRMLLSRFVG